jgi:hypothetical protein
MPYREVKIYDDPFPTHDQIISGDPTAPRFPKETWIEKVNPGEFAVRYNDFKTGLARNPQGEHVQASEICRIFDNLDEAPSNSAQVTKEHWTVRCLIYDHTGAQIGSVSKGAEINKFAVVMYAGTLLWVIPLALAGMGLIWGIYRLMLFLLAPGSEPIRSLNWVGWSVFVVAGLAVAALTWYVRLRRRAGRTVHKIRTSFTKEEMKKYEEVNSLYGTADPNERERLLKLTREYQEQIREAPKK